MLYPFKDDKTRVAMFYNGLSLNDPEDDPEDIYEINILAMDPEWAAVTEPKMLTHGLEVYHPRKVQNILRATGVVRSPTHGGLMDKVLALNAAFDPVNAYRNDYLVTRNRGFRAFSSSIPTADTTNYPDGLIAVHLNVRSIAQPVSRTTQFDGIACRFALALQAADPRLYFDDVQTASRTDAGALSVDNTLAAFPSWPTVTITISGSGSQVITLSMASAAETPVLTLDLTGLVSTDVVVVDMENREITLNGTVDMSLYSSGDYWEVAPAETSTLTIANTSGTLAGSVEVSWSRAIG